MIKFKVVDKTLVNSVFYTPDPIPLRLAWLRIRQDAVNYEINLYMGTEEGKEIYKKLTLVEFLGIIQENPQLLK